MVVYAIMEEKQEEAISATTRGYFFLHFTIIFLYSDQTYLFYFLLFSNEKNCCLRTISLTSFSVCSQWLWDRGEEGCGVQ